jgi:hypothetical protein
MGLVAVVLPFIPVLNLVGPLIAACAAAGGVLLLRRLSRDPHLTGRGMINTAIVLGAVAGALSLLMWGGWIVFWLSGRQSVM